MKYQNLDEFRNLIVKDGSLSFCSIQFDYKSRKNTVKTVETGEDWEPFGKYYFKMPKDFHAGQHVQVLSGRENKETILKYVKTKGMSKRGLRLQFEIIRKPNPMMAEMSELEANEMKYRAALQQVKNRKKKLERKQEELEKALEQQKARSAKAQVARQPLRGEAARGEKTAVEVLCLDDLENKKPLASKRTQA